MPVEIFFASLAFCGAIASCVLWILDRCNDSVLQRPEISKEPTETVASPSTQDTEQGPLVSMEPQDSFFS